MNGAEWWLRLDRVGFQAVWLLLSTLWQSSVLLVAAGLLAYALRRKRASVRHAVLAAAILASPLIPLLGWAASRSGTPQAPIPVMPSYSAPVLPAGPSEVALPRTALRSVPEAPMIPEIEDAPTAQPQQTQPPEKPFSLLAHPWALVFLAYAAGAAGLLCLVAIGKYRVGRWVRLGRVVTDPRVLGVFRAARERLGLDRGCMVAESRRVLTPMTGGTLHPMVLLPAGLAQDSSDDDLLAVALHELTHVRRCDSLLLMLLSFVRAALYFHPLIWLACRQVSALAESACDEAVLDATREPVSYAKMLVRLAEQLPRHAFATELTVGIVWRKGAFFRRVEAILSDRRGRIRKLTPLALLGTLIAAVLSVGLALAVPLAEKNEGQPARQPAPHGASTQLGELEIVPDPAAALKADLPEGLVIQREEPESAPFYLERGNGRAFYIGKPLDTIDQAKVKQTYTMVVWIMPADYAGREISTEPHRQTSVPPLAATARNGEVYVWPGSQDQIELVRGALLRPKLATVPAAQPSSAPASAQPGEKVREAAKAFLTALASGQDETATGMTMPGSVKSESFPKFREWYDLSDVRIDRLLISRDNACAVTSSLPGRRANPPMRMGLGLRRNGNRWLVRDVDALPSEKAVGEFIGGFKNAYPDFQERPAAPATAPAAGLSCPLDATIYELRLPPEEAARLDAAALTLAAASPAAFQKALADFGQAKLLYRMDQSVRLSGDGITISAQMPMVVSSRRTETGKWINVVRYESVGAIVKIVGWPEAGGSIHAELDIELSAMTESAARVIADTEPVSAVRKVTMAYKGSVRPGRPAVIISVDAGSPDAAGKAVAYLARIVLGTPQPDTQPSSAPASAQPATIGTEG